MYQLFTMHHTRHDVMLSNNRGCLWMLSHVTTAPIWCQHDEAPCTPWMAWSVHCTLWTHSHLSTFHHLDLMTTLIHLLLDLWSAHSCSPVAMEEVDTDVELLISLVQDTSELLIQSNKIFHHRCGNIFNTIHPFPAIWMLFFSFYI